MSIASENEMSVPRTPVCTTHRASIDKMATSASVQLALMETDVRTISMTALETLASMVALVLIKSMASHVNVPEDGKESDVKEI